MTFLKKNNCEDRYFNFKINYLNNLPSFYRDKNINDAYLSFKENIPLIRFKSLDKIPFINAAFTTRLGGNSTGIFFSMNLSSTRGDSLANVKENFKLIEKALHTNLSSIILTKQTHSTNIIRAEKKYAIGDDIKVKINDCDGLWTSEKNIILSLFFADCTPLYLVNLDTKSIALIHSGWKGTVNKISKNAVNILSQNNKSKDNIIAVIGPSISVCNYEVKNDVVDNFKLAFNETIWDDIFIKKDDTTYHLDLWAAIYHTLREEGIKKENIYFSGICTYENSNILFSHRKTLGKRGNMNAFLSII